jgi:ATP-dependent exoDNAse (exonuclease V) beta subunit
MQVTLYKSSAGSGKTFTLVRNYLNLALRNTLSGERAEVRTVRVRDLVDSEQAVRGPAVRVR